MRRSTQALLLVLLGALLLRLAISGDHVRFVTGWMRWPLVAAGLVLLVFAVAPLLPGAADGHDDHHDDHHDDDGHGHGAGVPRATWLLVLPAVVVFVMSPPELGSYLAERQGDQAVVSEPDQVTELDAERVVDLPLDEFLWRAQEGGQTLVDQQLSLTGFVSYGEGSTWFVTRMSISCCAADARAFKVRVADAPRPPRDQWVVVSGTYVEGTGSGGEQASIAASDVVDTVEPTRVYG